MGTTVINRGELTKIPFTITDANSGLAGKRVTWSAALTVGGARVLQKIGGLPGSTSDVTIATQTAGTITGTINIAVADYATLANQQYQTTLWVDSNISDDHMCSNDTLQIVPDVARLP